MSYAGCWLSSSWSWQGSRCHKARRDDLGQFGPGGRSLEAAVPIGPDDKRAAVGTGWQDTLSLFGPNTAYNGVRFSDEGAHCSGCTVALIEQVGGILGQTRLHARPD